MSFNVLTVVAAQCVSRLDIRHRECRVPAASLHDKSHRELVGCTIVNQCHVQPLLPRRTSPAAPATHLPMSG